MPNRQDLRPARAPASRVYSFEPGYRQRKFPTRKSSTLASVKLPPPQIQSKQKTLTQLDFAFVLPDSQSENGQEYQLLGEEEFEQNRLPKRRKVSKDLEETRQSTLTQIGFFEPGLFSDEYEESIGDVSDGEISIATESDLDEGMGIAVKEEPSSSPKLSMLDMQAAGPTKKVSPTPVLGPLRMSENASPTPILTPSPPQQIFKTPEKPVKREIPSSQSPPATPLIWMSPSLSRSQRVSPSPSRPQRTPLQEIPANVIATRDASPSRKSRKPSPASEDSDDEDEENVDPYPIKEEIMSQNKIYFSSPHKILNVADSNAPSICKPLSSQRAAKTTRASSDSNNTLPTSPYHSTRPPTIHSSQATTVDVTQPSPRGATQEFCVPSSPIFQIPSSYSVLPEDSQLPLSEDIGHYSPLSSIQGSADIVTVSQLLPDSLLED